MATWNLTGNANNPGGSFLGTTDAQPVIIMTGHSERLRIDAGGHLGIGIATPGFGLHLAAGKTLRIEGGQNAGDTTDYFSFGGNGSFGIDAPGVVNGRFIVQDSGNVGIGVPGPATRLHVAGGQWDLTNTEGDLKIGNDQLRIKIGVALGGGGAGDCRIRAAGGTNRLILGGGNDDTLIITNGNVGIGTGTPSTKLHVAGDVTVTGDVLLAGADCAEEFELEAGEAGDPGTVVVIDDSGGLRQSHQAYDKRVAGVVSGAGDYRPGLVLDKRPPSESRIQVALVGKVWCKAEAEGCAIRVGDLLTTSTTPGHAMKATDPVGAFGAVIGKALQPLPTGRSLIPILVALQ